MKIIDVCDDLLKGYGLIRYSDRDKIPETDKPLFKILTLKNIRELIEGQEVKYSLIAFEQKYQKNILYVKKNDIVITVATGTSKFSVMYIENEPNEKYIYNNSCLVLRIKEDIISSKFVYLQLMTNKIQEKLLGNAKGNFIKHITKDDVLSIELPDLEKNEIEEICKNYDNIKKKEEEVKIEEQQFWDNLNKLYK